MVGHVWISHNAGPRNNHYGFDFDDTVDTDDQILSKYHTIKDHTRIGKPAPVDLLPPRLVTPGKGSGLRQVPPLYVDWPVAVISGEVVDVLRGFELGRTTLHPVELYRADRDEVLGGGHHFLNIGERKDALIAEQSTSLRPVFEEGQFKTSALLKDDECAVRSSVLKGADLWIDWAFPFKIFFVSDRLYQALKAAKLHKKLTLKRCRVIERGLI